MGHAIYFAAWMVPVVLLAAFQAMEDPAKFWRRFHGAVAILGCVAILLSGTRGAVLAVAVGAGVMLARSRGPDSGAFRRRLVLFAALLVASAGLFAISPLGGNLRHRLLQWGQDPGGPRLLLWRESPALMLRHPLLGTGPETFAVEFRELESPEMSRAYPDFYHETPHNALLDAATGQGIPGLLILAALFVLGFSSKSRAVQAAIVGIFISAMFASLTIVEAIFLWTLVAISIASDSPDVPAAARRGWSLPRWTMVPATVTGVLFIGFALLLAMSDAADLRLSNAVAGNDFPAAEAAYTTSLAWSRGLPGYELFLSREMATLAVALGNTPNAAVAWKDAASASALAESRGEERFSAAFQSCVLSIASGDLRRAEDGARRAIDLAPNWYKPHLFLGQILQAAGRPDEAAAEQRIAVDLHPPVK